MTDYTAADYAVFDRMPDTATKAEIRSAIMAARDARAGLREQMIETANGWTSAYHHPIPWPRTWENEHRAVVTLALRWLIDSVLPEETP